MLVKYQETVLELYENKPRRLNNALRSKREMTLEEKKGVCKGLKISSIAFDTIGNVANDVGDLSGEALKPYTMCVSIISHLVKFGLNIASAALECDDVPFDELKNILDERFKQLERKLDASTEAMEKLSKLASEAYVVVEQARYEMNDGFKEILNTLENQKVKSIVNELNTFDEYFEKEKKEIKKLSKDEYVKKLQEENGVLKFLRDSRLPNEDSLNSILFRLLDKNNKFTIPKRVDDITAFQALYALFYGTQTYASIMFFLLEHHSYLANNHYENADLNDYNEEFVTIKNIFDEFKLSLVGLDEDKPLLKEVIDVFKDVKNLPFIDKVELTVYKDLLKMEETIVVLKSNIEKMELPIIQQTPDTAANVDFVKPVLRPPFGKWKKDSSVKYAVQLMQDGKFSKISDWSQAFTVQKETNPTLTFAVDEERRDRLIFRKFDNFKPELVGILKFPEVEFKDMNRDLFNAAASVHKVKALMEVKNLIRIKADFNEVFERKRNALYAAAESGNDDVANFLLNEGADINIEDEKGYTPLHVASEANRHNLVMLLIKKGANVNAQSKAELLTPLHIASKNGFLDTVQALLSSKNLSINEKDASGLTALHQAVHKSPGIVRALTSSIYTEVNAKSNVGLTPFHVVVMQGNRELADALLESGRVNVNEGDINGLTALHFASMTQKVENVKFLLSLEDIQVNIQSKDVEFTPLHLAIYSKQEQIAFELMKHNNIDLEVLAKGALTPLHLSVATGQLNICKELLKKNSNIEAKTGEGYTPLHLSTMHLDPDIVTLLLENGANIEANSNDGSTSLHFAVKSDRVETAMRLLDNNANINAQMKDGSTPLHLAVSLKLNDLVVKLLSRGANASIKDIKDLTPIYIAIQNDDLDILRSFVQYLPNYEQVVIEQNVSDFMLQDFNRDMYDYLKNMHSEKYKKYEGLTLQEVYTKLGKHEMFKILYNDPNNVHLDGFIEIILNLALNFVKDCINAETQNTPRDPKCPELFRQRRNGKRSSAMENSYSSKVLFFQSTPSLGTSGNYLISPLLNITNEGNSFIPQFNAFNYYNELNSLVLLDLLIRKLNNGKYFKKTAAMHSDLDLQAKALTITENIEKLLEIVSNGSPADELVDLSEVHSKIYKALKSENENDIVKLLSSTFKNVFNS